jgi:hypothetical protein
VVMRVQYLERTAIANPHYRHRDLYCQFFGIVGMRLSIKTNNMTCFGIASDFVSMERAKLNLNSGLFSGHI